MKIAAVVRRITVRPGEGFDSLEALLSDGTLKGWGKDDEGQVLEGRKRGGGILPSWLMSERKKQLNEMAGSQRALCQGNCAPNHYWDRAKNATRDAWDRLEGERANSSSASSERR